VFLARSRWRCRLYPGHLREVRSENALHEGLNTVVEESPVSGQHGAAPSCASAQCQNIADWRARRRQDFPDTVSRERGIRGGGAE